MSYTISYLPTNEGTVKARRYFVADTAAELPVVSPAVDGDIGYAKGTDTTYSYNGTVWTASGSVLGYVTKSANYTTTASDFYILVTAACTITLITAVGNTGRGCEIKATVDNVTVDPNGSQTIDGELTVILMQNDGMKIFSDGANWRIA